jgi:hypothetical protein
MADYWLIVQQDGAERRFRLEQDETLLGQAADCDLRLAHPTVSRHHARLRREGDLFVLCDLGSTNGSFVDGVRADQARVSPGRPMRLGDVGLRIERRAGDIPLRIDIDGISPGSAEDAARTQPAGACVRFLLVELPRLLADSREARGAGPFARACVAALAATFPGSSICIQRRLGDAIALLAGDASVEESATVSRCDRPPYRFVWDAADAAAELPVLFALLGELLAFMESAPVAAGAGGSEPGPPAVPAPAPADQRMREIYRLAARIGRARDVNVLIEGESGTGKEVLAGYLHACAGGPDAPLVALNCAALPRDLLEAELFGIERGVATGVDARAGKFELADGGTLFLDEIGEMPADMQAKLLRVLQDGQVQRVGARAARRVEVRVIAATNGDLHALIEAGSFRRDLFHRIADWSVTLPPLRERPADLLALAGHFLETEMRRRGIASSGLGRDAVAALRKYDWPGNVRELEREMRRAALFLENGQILDAAQLSERLRETTGRPAGRESRLDEAQLREAIAAARGNMSAAAERLGIARSTLYRRMKALGLATD